MRSIERPWKYSEMGKPNGRKCEDCGTECNDRCLVCGAPQCCPKCCIEATSEIEALLAVEQPPTSEKASVMPDEITNPKFFARWWQFRNSPGDDREIVEAALEAGLITRTGNRLFLTAAGDALRNSTLGQPLHDVRPPPDEIDNPRRNSQMLAAYQGSGLEWTFPVSPPLREALEQEALAHIAAEAATDGPREADEQPCVSPEGACETKAPLCLTDEQQVLTEPQLVEMMRDPCYWRKCDPDWIATVTKGFKKLYPSLTKPIPDEMVAELDAAIAKTEQTLRLADELEQARQARDLLNRLERERKIAIRLLPYPTTSPLVVSRLVPRVEYDEEVLP